MRLGVILAAIFILASPLLPDPTMFLPRRAVPSLLLVTSLLALPVVVSAQTWGQYGVEVLPLPVGGYSFGYGSPVNDAGEVVGGYNNGSFFEAFLFDGSAIQGLGTLGQTFSRAYAINNAGLVSGFSRNGDGRNEAFLYSSSSGTMTGLGTLTPGSPIQESYGVGISSNGLVAGYSRNADGLFEGALLDGSTVTGVGMLSPGGFSYAQSVNSAGSVVGYSLNGSYQEAFLFDGSTTLGLGTLGGVRSYAVDINDAGAVVGYSSDASGAFQAFLYEGAGLIGLGTLGGTTSYAYGISGSGQVVGRVAGGSVGQRAALWEGGSGYYLDALVGGGWTFIGAQGISDGGTVLALGSNADVNGGANTWVVLKQQGATSVPEPGTWVLFATGLMGLLVVGQRRMGVTED